MSCCFGFRAACSVSWQLFLRSTRPCSTGACSNLSVSCFPPAARGQGYPSRAIREQEPTAAQARGLVPTLLPQPALGTRNCVTAQGRGGPCSPAGCAGLQPTATQTPQPGQRDPARAEGEPPATPRVELHAGICPRRLGCNYSVKLGGSVSS